MNNIEETPVNLNPQKKETKQVSKLTRNEKRDLLIGLNMIIFGVILFIFYTL